MVSARCIAGTTGAGKFRALTLFRRPKCLRASETALAADKSTVLAVLDSQGQLMRATIVAHRWKREFLCSHTILLHFAC